MYVTCSSCLFHVSRQSVFVYKFMCIRVFHIMFYICLSMTVYTSTKRTFFIQYFSNRSFRLQLFQKRIVTYHVVSYVSNVSVCVNLSVSYICLYLSCLSLYVGICVNECFFFLVHWPTGPPNSDLDDLGSVSLFFVSDANMH